MLHKGKRTKSKEIFKGSKVAFSSLLSRRVQCCMNGLFMAYSDVRFPVTDNWTRSTTGKTQQVAKAECFSHCVAPKGTGQ